MDAGLYRPLTLLSFGVNRLLGSSAFGFHLVNHLLHAGASVLALFAARAVGMSRFGALAAGLVFALHPIQSEAVLAIVGRAEILAFCLAMGAFLLFARRAPAIWIGLAFFLALCSKESAAFSLSLFVLYALVHERNIAPARFAPLGAAVAVYAACRVAVLGGIGIGGREIGFLDNPVAGAGLATRLLTAPALVLEYAKRIVWPRVLSADYSYDQIAVPASAADPRVLGGIALLLAAGVAIYYVPRIRFGGLAFLLPLAGFLHLLFPLGTIFAERLLYLPMFGVALLAGRALGALGRHAPRLAGAALALFALAAVLRVAERARDWRDNETLFRATVLASPRSARAHFLLGSELLEQERFEDAAAAFARGLAIYPEHFGARMSLGEARLAAGDAAAAEAAFRDALEIEPRSADARRAALEASLAAGRERAREGDFPAARERFRAALELEPGHPEALNYLGLVAEREGNVDAARELYERALDARPDFADALVNLASLRMSAGALEEAESLFRRATELAPRSYEAYNGLGIALARQNRLPEAAEAFRAAIAIDPGLEIARSNLRALGDNVP